MSDRGCPRIFQGDFFPTKLSAVVSCSYFQITDSWEYYRGRTDNFPVLFVLTTTKRYRRFIGNHWTISQHTTKDFHEAHLWMYRDQAKMWKPARCAIRQCCKPLLPTKASQEFMLDLNDIQCQFHHNCAKPQSSLEISQLYSERELIIQPHLNYFWYTNDTSNL